MSGVEGAARAGAFSSRAGNVSLALSIAAIVVALGAVGIGWAIPRPAGSNGANCWDLNGNGIADPATEDRNGDSLVNVLDCTGPQGPQGPPGAPGPQGPPGPRGNGPIMAIGGIEQLTQVTTTCARAVGSPVSITVPGPGTIVANAKVWVALDHTSGSTDQIVITVNATTNCTRDVWAGDALASFSLPTDYYYYNVPVLRPFAVAAAGTYVYGVNGVMLQGASAGDGIHKWVLELVFYPN